MVMAAKIFKRLSVKTPAELAQKTHQAFVRLPYESSPERIVEDLARLLAGLKVPAPPPRRPFKSPFPPLFLTHTLSTNHPHLKPHISLLFSPN
jgi:hypothetical protein